MTTAWHHAHPANQRPVLKACLKKQSQTGSFHSSKSKERGGKKELNKKGSLGICGHWKLWKSGDTGKYKHRHWKLSESADSGKYKHRHWKLWESADTGKYKHRHWKLWESADTGKYKHRHWKLSESVDSGKYKCIHTCAWMHTQTAIQVQVRCLHAQCCLQAPTPGQHYSTIIRHTNAEYKEDRYHNSQMRGKNTSTIKRLLHLWKNTPTKTHYCESV